MSAFLKYVADDILATFGTNLQNVVVVFPNKRANLFLNEYLALKADRPLWAPTYMSIADLFRSFTDLQVGDHILLVCQLYQSYLQVTGKTEADESLDQFFSWGEILLADFDDVDKNMVDANQLFRNLKELKELDADTRSYLSEDQLQLLSEFFQKFSFEETELQKRFTKLWDVIGQLYETFNAQLEMQGLQYEGALYRDVLHQLKEEKLTADCYLFVGFNVLDKVEEQLFTRLQEMGKARFYWDYDTYYLDPHSKTNFMEAGHFLVKNVTRFGNALPEEYFQSMKQPKTVDYVSAPTESAQVRYVSPWLNNHPSSNAKDTAIVLCNEQLLEPVLHVIPDGCINITMGFPLSDTPMFSFVQSLCNLYNEGFSIQNESYRLDQLSQVLLHPYTRILYGESSELLDKLKQNRHFLVKPAELHVTESMQLLFPDQLTDRSPIAYIMQVVELLAQQWKNVEEIQDPTFAPLYKEALFKTFSMCKRLQNLVDDGLLRVKYKSLTRFLFQLMCSQSIPFHGEPAIGLQVMGVLETRNLDFKHVIMLSTNEGMLPKNGAEASFIPYNLRKAFGMTLIEQKIAVYAYYFYRLLQRAEHVTFLYNNNTQGLQKGEMSRFMQQYLIEHPKNHTVRQIALNSTMTADAVQPITIQKTPEMVEKLLRKHENRILSPSALNTFIDCQLKYYFKYVAKMNVEEDISDNINAAVFGNLFHRSSELVYRDMMRIDGQNIRASYIEDALKNEAKLAEIVKFAMKEHLFQVAKDSGFKENSPEYMEYILKAPMPVLNGTQTIVQSVILMYVKRLLEFDLKLAPFTILGLEKPIQMMFPIRVNGQEYSIKIGGIIDRLDKCLSPEGKQTIRVVDYKTTDGRQTAKDVNDLIDNTKSSRAYHIFQAMYYAIQIDKAGLNPHKELISPALFYILQASEDYNPIIKLGSKEITDFRNDCQADYEDVLRGVLESLFDVKKPFIQTDNDHPCQYCDFREICMR